MEKRGDKRASAWEGRLVRLRAITESDWERFHGDAADTEAQRLHSAIEPPRSPEAARRSTQEQATTEPKGDQRVWAIETDGGELVGSISTGRCEPRHGTFSFGLGIFRPHWRRGYGRDAIRVLLRHFFEELRYQKANSGVYAFNEASIALHESLGFSLEGRQRRMVYTAGEYHDELLFGLTAEEFREIGRRDG